MNRWMTVVLLSLLPVTELRGGIPFALALGIHPVRAFVSCVLVNILAVPITFFFLSTLHLWLWRHVTYRTLFSRYVVRTREKLREPIRKYGYLGLTVFVAVPLPATGAYTGALAAWVFGLERTKAFCAISLGVFFAGLIVLAGSLSGSAVLSWTFRG